MSREITELIIQVDTSEVGQAEQALKKVGIQSDSVSKKVPRATKSFGVMKGATQQLGFQVQDLAVQLQGGTSFIQAFTQQGSQMAGVFGPGGAVIGAIIAVGGALGGVLFKSLLDTEEKVEDLDKAFAELEKTFRITNDGAVVLTQGFERLAAESRDLAELTLKQNLLKATLTLSTAFDTAAKAADSFDVGIKRSGQAGRAYANQLRKMGKDLGLSVDQLEKLSEAANTFESNQSMENMEALAETMNELSKTGASDEMVKLTSDITGAMIQAVRANKILEKTEEILSKDLDKALEENGESSIEAARKAEEAAARQEKAADRIYQARKKKNANDLAKLEQEIAKKELQLGQQLERSRSDRERKKAEAEKARFENSRRAMAEHNKFATQMDLERAEAERQQYENRMYAADSFFGDLSSLMNTQSRKAFEIGRAAAVANAIVSGIESAIHAYKFGSQIGGPVAGALMAAASAASTGVYIAQLKSAKPPGRAQGGQVRPGQAYRVGEYGPETLVMGSNGGTITPSGSSGSSANIVMHTNVKVIGGNGQEPDVKTSTKQLSDRKFVTDIVIDQMARSNSQARQALHSSSNVRPRGNM